MSLGAGPAYRADDVTIGLKTLIFILIARLFQLFFFDRFCVEMTKRFLISLYQLLLPGVKGKYWSGKGIVQEGGLALKQGRIKGEL